MTKRNRNALWPLAQGGRRKIIFPAIGAGIRHKRGCPPKYPRWRAASLTQSASIRRPSRALSRLTALPWIAQARASPGATARQMPSAKEGRAGFGRRKAADSLIIRAMRLETGASHGETANWQRAKPSRRATFPEIAILPLSRRPAAPRRAQTFPHPAGSPWADRLQSMFEKGRIRDFEGIFRQFQQRVRSAKWRKRRRNCISENFQTGSSAANTAPIVHTPVHPQKRATRRELPPSKANGGVWPPEPDGRCLPEKAARRFRAAGLTKLRGKSAFRARKVEALSSLCANARAGQPLAAETALTPAYAAKDKFPRKGFAAPRPRGPV